VERRREAPGQERRTGQEENENKLGHSSCTSRTKWLQERIDSKQECREDEAWQGFSCPFLEEKCNWSARTRWEAGAIVQVAKALSLHMQTRKEVVLPCGMK
jgi:hypothetical protein